MHACTNVIFAWGHSKLPSGAGGCFGARPPHSPSFANFRTMLRRAGVALRSNLAARAFSGSAAPTVRLPETRAFINNEVHRSFHLSCQNVMQTHLSGLGGCRASSMGSSDAPVQGSTKRCEECGTVAPLVRCCWRELHRAYAGRVYHPGRFGHSRDLAA